MTDYGREADRINKSEREINRGRESKET